MKINPKIMSNRFPVVVILAVTTMFPLGCIKGNYSERGTSDVSKLMFTIEDYQVIQDDVPLTKTSVQNGNEFIWAEGDTVGIYPNSGAQVYFVMSSGSGAKSATFDGGGWAFKTSATYYSYYPFIGNIYLDRHKIPVNYVGQKQKGLTGINHIGAFDYMYTVATTSENETLSFAYKHLGCIIRPKLTLPAGTYTKLAITAPSDAFVKSGCFDLQSDSPSIEASEHVKQLQIDLDEITVDGTTTFQVYVMSAPVNLKGIELTISVLNDQKKELQCKKTPSVNYSAGIIGGLTCSSWTEVPQSMGMIIDGWDDGDSIGGDAE